VISIYIGNEASLRSLPETTETFMRSLFVGSCGRLVANYWKDWGGSWGTTFGEKARRFKISALLDETYSSPPEEGIMPRKARLRNYDPNRCRFFIWFQRFACVGPGFAGKDPTSGSSYGSAEAGSQFAGCFCIRSRYRLATWTYTVAKLTTCIWFEKQVACVSPVGAMRKRGDG